MWDLPWPGLEPVSPALASGFLSTAPPGKSLNVHCKKPLSSDSNSSCHDGGKFSLSHLWAFLSSSLGVLRNSAKHSGRALWSSVHIGHFLKDLLQSWQPPHCSSSLSASWSPGTEGPIFLHVSCSPSPPKSCHWPRSLWGSLWGSCYWRNPKPLSSSKSQKARFCFRGTPDIFVQPLPLLRVSSMLSS